MTRPPIRDVLEAGPLSPAVAAAALALAHAAAGRLDDLEDVYRAALAIGVPVEVLREGALSAHLFCGFPRAIEAFRRLDVAAGGLPPPPDDDRTETTFSGSSLFERIYGEQAAAVRGILRRFHPVFEAAVLEDAYGRILARPSMEARTRELLAVCALTAARLPLQLESHLRGALRCGAARGDVEAAVALGGVVGGEEAAREGRALLSRLAPGHDDSGSGADGSPGRL